MVHGHMSRLDSFIRRMQAQRDVLNHIADNGWVPIDGLVLEVGLGNGRTYDHLREKFTTQRIVVFDRSAHTHPASTPSEEDMILGEISETIKQFAGADAALAHVDIGTFSADIDASTLTWLPQSIVAVLATGGLAASGLPLEHDMLEPLPLPSGVVDGHCYFYRRI
jgi:hypothetical protein